MKKIITAMLGIGVLLVVSCQVFAQSGFKEFTVYNISDKTIYLIECKGIDIFGDGRDSALTTMYGDNGEDTARRYRPDGSMTISTWGDVVHVTYPVIVKWAYASDRDDIHETRFDQIANLPKGQQTIRKEGSFHLVFHDGRFSLFWVEGESYLQAADYRRILENDNRADGATDTHTVR